jgi:predicted nucleotidyltransferase
MFQQLLEAIALALDAQSLPYMLIGGQAVLLYGEPRLTQDIDITLGIGPERAGDLLDVVYKLNWQILVDDVQAFVRRTLILPCMEPQTGVRVDFIFSFSPYERQAIERARSVLIGKAQVRFAAVEDLVVHKVIAGRPRDLEDVQNVLTKNPGLDVAYIREWLGQFEASLGDPLRQRFNELWEASQRI